jgi:hypothetical protein
LSDIVVGLPYESIKRRWAEKMDPTQYQRPTRVSEGNIVQAEKLVEKLGITKSLERRYARLDEVTAMWMPGSLPEEPKKAGGLFDHLKKDAKIKELELPAKALSWEKFQREVLPTALGIEALMPVGNAPFYGLTTATHAESPPMLQWDGLAGQPRNPVSWYFYQHGSPAVAWSLVPGQWVKVNAVCVIPTMWQEPERFKHHGEQILLVLAGAKDVNPKVGLAIFPETLKSEFREIRSVIEAYSKSQHLTGVEEASANGIALAKGNMFYHIKVRVTTAVGQFSYSLDRWD